MRVYVMLENLWIHEIIINTSRMGKKITNLSDTSSSVKSIINTPLLLGSLQLKNRLIQGPLAGYSCAPFRQLFTLFMPPAYCVSEMLSAHDVLYKHHPHSRYLFRGDAEKTLCYQIAGTCPTLMAEAAIKLEHLQASLIDINCGCPKPKIRKKGAGSALLEKPDQLIKIVKAVRNAIKCPLTVKVRLQNSDKDISLAKAIADAGADAIVVHGRHWVDDYDKPCSLQKIAAIKQAVDIPVIVNGDIANHDSLNQAWTETNCDGFMISRASTGKPWLFQELLTNTVIHMDNARRIKIFMTHLYGLSELENECKAVLQSKSLVHYYFKHQFGPDFFQMFYQLIRLQDIESALNSHAAAPM